MKNKILIILITLIIFPFIVDAAEIEKPLESEKYEGMAYIFEETGIKMYSSPSINEKNVISTIPYNTLVNNTANRFIGETKEQWLYVKYNNQEGWINYIKENEFYKIGNKIENNFKSVHKDINVFKTTDTSSEQIGIIKSSQKVKVLYSYGNFMNLWYYVESENIKGWTNDILSFVEELEEKIVLLNDGYEYNEAYEKGNKIVNKNSVISIKSTKLVNNEKFAIYNHNGKEVWIKISGTDANYAYQIQNDNLANEMSVIVNGDSVYEDLSASSKELFKIKDTTKIENAYHYKDPNNGDDFYYIVSNDGNGWVTKAFYSYVEETSTKSDDNNDENKGKIPLVLIIIFSVVVLFGIIGIILFNNKKNSIQK